VLSAMMIIPLMSTAEPQIGRSSQDFVVASFKGKVHRLKHYRGKNVVLEWVNFECPYVQRLYQEGTMQELKKAHVENGGVWLSIISESPRRLGFFWKRRLRQKLQEYGVDSASILIDKKGAVGRLYHVPLSPYIVLIDTKGVIQYLGSVDDREFLADHGFKKARNYLEEALVALYAGSKVGKSKTKPFGCNIRYH